MKFSFAGMIPHFMMVLFALIIAGSFPVVAAITRDMDSVVLTFWRFFLATAVFGIMLPFVKDDIQVPTWKDLGRYATVGGSYGLFFVFMFQALKTTSPLNTSTIYTTLPLMTMLVGAVVGEPVFYRQLGVLSISMLATLWVIFRGNVDNLLQLHINTGDLIFLFGTLCIAVYMVSMKKLQKKESKIRFTFYSLLFATLVMFVASILRTGSLPFPHFGTWLGVAYLAGPSTAVTFWIVQYTALRLSPSRIVGYTFLTPSIVACIEWGMGLSPPEPEVLPGIGLTLVAVWLLQLECVSGPLHPSLSRSKQ